MDETLLNCPLCGGEARFETYGGTACAVVCQSCHCGTPTMSLVDGMAAVNRWNLRAERTCRNELSGYTDCMGRPVPDQFRCSECGGHSRTMFDVGFGDMASKAPRYCPSCGARVIAPDGGA